LSILYVLDGKVSFDLLLDKNAFPGSETMIDCMFSKSRYDVVTTTDDLFRRRLITETIYYGEIKEILTSNIPLQILVGISLLMLLASVCFRLLKKEKRVDYRENSKREKIEQLFRDFQILIKDYQHTVDQDEIMKEVVVK